MGLARSLYRSFGKRALDVALAVPALVVAAPVLAGSAAAVFVSIGRPVFFRHKRPGLHGRPFVLLKFRTMTHAKGTDGEPLPDDQRLTRVGRFLRRTSLDELPTLWNVVRGDMSLVGPRPLLMEYLPRYSPVHARRHEVRPGITGLAQVNGRHTSRFSQRLALDVRYVDEHGLFTDLGILWKTLAHMRADVVEEQMGSAEEIDDVGLYMRDGKAIAFARDAE